MAPLDFGELLSRRECFLFDLDGTLVDSSACHERAYLAALEELAPGFNSKFQYERYKGWRTRDVFADLGIRNKQMLDALTESKQRFYRAEVDAGRVESFPGSREILAWLRERRRRLFLVTGGSAQSTRAVLDRLEIAGWFEGVVTGEDAPRSKPAPDAYLTCLSRFAIDRRTAIAIEDAASGVESAQAAGLEVIAVHNPELAGTRGYAGTLADLWAHLRRSLVKS